MGSFRLSTG